jgi:pilus assembly protein CpaB
LPESEEAWNNMARATRIVAIFLIALAVVLGGFAWTIARRPPPPALQQAQGPAGLPVVVAARELSASKPIEADELTVQISPTRAPGAYGDPAALVGRVPLAPIAANTPVLDANLASGLADAIAPGERAVAVRVDETTAVGNRVKPGNFVDVFFLLKRDSIAGNAEIETTQARLLLSRIRVLSFGDATLAGTADPSDTANAAARNGGARTAVLAVPVADIDALTLAQNAGQLTLALRNPSDPDASGPVAFAPLLASIKLSAGTATDASARAAEGVSLGALAGASTVKLAAPVLSSPLAQPVRSLPRTVRPQAATSQMEVIRGGYSEKVAY